MRMVPDILHYVKTVNRRLLMETTLYFKFFLEK